jgi:hypothetical protein
MSNHKRAMPYSRLLASLALLLFIASLLPPAFTCKSGIEFSGYAVLSFGWAGILGLDPRWFANIGFLVLVARCFANPKRFPRIALAAALLAASSFAPAAGCPATGGAPAMSSGLALSGWLWVAAILCACSANLMSTPADQVSAVSVRPTPDLQGGLRIGPET